MSDKPKVSIIIVNFNGEKYLKDCIASLLTNKTPRFEIIAVDNGSSDDSVKVFENLKFKIENSLKIVNCKLKIVENGSNLGFAGGNNIGIKHAEGEYVLLLNNDTVVEKDFLSSLLKAFEEIPNLGCVQPKIVLVKDNNIIDSCGSFFTDSSFLYHYGYDKNQELEIYNKPFPVFSVKGVAMLMRKDLIDKIGLFDDDFWSYYEETDFCHRVWLVGYECWYYPRAKVFHAAGGTSLVYFKNDFIQFSNFKNKLASFLKNFQISFLIRLMPIYLLINFLLSFFWLVSGKPRHFLSLHKALWWNIINLPKILTKRKKIQLLRVRTDSEIMKVAKKNPGIRYYYFLFKGLKNYKDREVL